MPNPRTASPPLSPTDWNLDVPGGRASVETHGSWTRGIVESTLAQRRRASETPAITVTTRNPTREEVVDDGNGARASLRSSVSAATTLQPPPSPHSPVGLLLFRRRSFSTTPEVGNGDASTLPIHPLDVPGPSSRRSSDAASSALEQIAPSTTSRRSSWTKSVVEHSDNTRTRPSSSQHFPPPSCSSSLFAATLSNASAASTSQYLGQQTLFSIEASPLIPTSAETTPGTTPDSLCTPSFTSSSIGDQSSPIEPFAKFHDAPVRRASYAVVTLDSHGPPSRAPSLAFAPPAPPAPLSARSVRRQLRRILVAAVSLFVLVCIIRPSRLALVPALATLHLSPFTKHSDVSHFLPAPMRPGIWPRNKTYSTGARQVDETVLQAGEGESSAIAVPPVRDEVRQFRTEQLWAPPSTPNLKTRVVEPRPGAEHEATIVMLHGLSQTVEHSSWLHAELGAKLPSVRWVMPQAPKLPITYHDQELRPAWFDIKSFPWDAVQDSDEDHYYESVRAINGVIRRERDRLVLAQRERLGQDVTSSAPAPASREELESASKRILLGGFSQGGVMTLLAGLTNEYELGGLFVFSGMLPVRALLPELVRDLNRTDLPIWWGHGEIDPYLLSVDASSSVEVLRDPSPGLAQSRVTFEVYPRLGHTWSRKQVDDLSHWMRVTVGAPFVSVTSHAHEKASMRRRRR